MSRFSRILLCVVVSMGMVGQFSEAAFPDYLDLYREDPFRRADVDGCNVCHISPSGGGAHNSFGIAFFDAGERITPMMRADYPDRFDYPTPSIGDMVVHFADPENNKVVIELAGTKYLVDLESRSIPGLAPKAPSEEPSPSDEAPSASFTSAGDERPVDEYAYEGAFFGSRIVNLPNAKPMERGGVEFLVGHRFRGAIFNRDSPKNLFGFDTGAIVTFGVQVGLTDWMSVQVLRSAEGPRTIELSSALQFSRQGESAPLSTQLRVGVEGRQNFTERFAPFVQFVSTRSFGDRFSLAVAPSIAFNTRNEESPFPPSLLFGEEFDYTAALGLGAGLRLTPTVSLIGEYIPRLKGFKGELFDRPAVSFGVQKSTFRHTFELVFSTARPMTTAQYTVNGTDAFKIGFNIYRRLR